ncbi:MAG: DUF721 domain-containing protein [Ignavibacteria bacterium]|nr:DUF721 domain-containing protein [Ignavibacteria bacterium]MBI3766738.1 DUF721 domain-containing protein [Ignavibacteriales bacterium]
MRTSVPKPISSAIANTFQQLGIGVKVRQYEMLDRWPSIVGEQIATIATAERIRDGKLFVRVNHPTWRNELVFLKKELVRKINSTMNQEIVKDIIFR